MLKRRQVIVIFVFVLLIVLPFAVIGKKSSKISSSRFTTRRPAQRITRGRTSPPRTHPPRTSPPRTHYVKTTTPRPRYTTKHSPTKRLPITTLPPNFYGSKSTRRTTIYETTTPRYQYTTPSKISHGTVGSSNSRPIGFAPPGSLGHSNPSQTGTGTQRPIGFVPPGSLGHSNQLIGPPKTVGTQGNTPNLSGPSGKNGTKPGFGWQTPPPKNHTATGSWTTRKPNITSGGWQVPPTNGGGIIGWTSPKPIVPNVGSRIPLYNNSKPIYPTSPPNKNIGWTHPPPSNNGWPQQKNISNIGSQKPPYNASKPHFPTSSPNKTIGWNPSVQTTLPPRFNNQWTSKANVTNVGNSPNSVWRLPSNNYSRPGFSPSLPNQSDGWLKPKNATNVGWVPNYSPVITPRPPVIPSFVPGHTNNGVMHVPQQQHPHYSTPTHSYWNQGYNTPSYPPTYTPIINNHYTTNYGYVPPPVTIINNNVNNHIHYPGYSYSTRDYGNDNFGFYLGYQLGKLSRPSYHYYTPTYYNGHQHVSLYDHYEIHHYYHNKENVNKEAKVEATQVIACPGDSYALCPPSTTALCLNGGSVMCVVKTDATSPCPTDSTLRCSTSSIPCVRAAQPGCDEPKTKSVTASIPCLSTITVNGSLVNNNNFISIGNSTQELNSLCVTVAALPAESKVTKKKFQEYRQRKTYHYRTIDMGTSPFGLLLGQTLEELLDPGYKYLNYLQNGTYIEKFDHYYVYNFYVNKDLLPKTIDIYSNNTAACFGDSATICPNKTISLCTSDGSVLCLVLSKDAKPCNETINGCVVQNIYCNGSKIPDCRNNTNLNVTIPCFTSVKLHGNVSSINTTFVFNNITKRYSTLQVLPNATVVHSYLLAVLAVPAEIITENWINKEVRQIHNSSEVYHNVPSYDYGKNKLKSSSIDYFLADKLEKLSFPGYYYLNIEIANNLGEIQKYDHYDIQYNTSNSIYLPKEQNISRNEIIPCAGDSGIICPPNTTALCLINGMVTCVTDALMTVRCDNVTKQGNDCVKLTLPCGKRTSRGCLNKRINWNISLPCMSFFVVHGNVIYVQNSLTVFKEHRYGSKYKYNYTDLEVIDSENDNKKQIFCVTVVAAPAERVIPEGERWFRNFKHGLSKFMTSVIGL